MKILGLTILFYAVILNASAVNPALFIERERERSSVTWNRLDEVWRTDVMKKEINMTEREEGDENERRNRGEANKY